MNEPTHDVYADASKGPFLCGVCEYFKPPTNCTQPEIVKLRKGVVEYYGCCDFFERDPSLHSTAGLLKRAMKKADG
jgi:hypothetical protein